MLSRRAKADSFALMDLQTLRTTLEDIADTADPNSSVFAVTSAGEQVDIRSVLPVHTSDNHSIIVIRLRSSL
jgi:hypothetical protein